MKQLKESILDKGFDVNVDFADADFINKEVFKDYVNEAKAVNTELCANIMFAGLRDVIQKYKQDLQAAGITFKEVEDSGKYYDPAKKPVWVADEVVDYDVNSIKKRQNLINFLHLIDKFMDKNVKNWSNTKLYKGEYPLFVYDGMTGVEMKLDETPENIEHVKRLASIKDKNFKVEDWGPNKVHTYFMGFVPTKKQY